MFKCNDYSKLGKSFKQKDLVERQSRNDLQTAQRKVITEYAEDVKNRVARKVVKNTANNWSSIGLSAETENSLESIT